MLAVWHESVNQVSKLVQSNPNYMFEQLFSLALLSYLLYLGVEIIASIAINMGWSRFNKETIKILKLDYTLWKRLLYSRLSWFALFFLVFGLAAQVLHSPAMMVLTTWGWMLSYGAFMLSRGLRVVNGVSRNAMIANLLHQAEQYPQRKEAIKKQLSQLLKDISNSWSFYIDKYRHDNGSAK